MNDKKYVKIFKYLGGIGIVVIRVDIIEKLFNMNVLELWDGKIKVILKGK